MPQTTYHIHKSSRLPSPSGYRGPTCGKAGVEPGKTYTTREEAWTDAHKLNQHNAVGFSVASSEEIEAIWNTLGQ